MDFDNCFKLGKVAKTRGFKGQLSLYLDVDNPYDYKKMESIFIDINKKLIPFFLDDISIDRKGYALVRLNGVSSEEQAKALVGKDLYLPLTVLPKPKKDSFYYHDIIGFEVEDEIHGFIGKVHEFYDVPGNNLLGVVNDSGIEILVPANNQILIKADFDKKKLHTNLPEGLLDIYL